MGEWINKIKWKHVDNKCQNGKWMLSPITLNVNQLNTLKKIFTDLVQNTWNNYAFTLQVRRMIKHMIIKIYLILYLFV